MCMRQRGFTLIELVVVITILGILVVVASARFSGTDSLSAFGARDEVASAFRLAQRYAVTSGCSTQITLTSNSYTALVENAPCGGAASYGTSIAAAGAGGTLSGTFTGVTLTTGTFRYDAYGDLLTGGGTVTATSNGVAASFVVQSGSGFVDLP